VTLKSEKTKKSHAQTRKYVQEAIFGSSDGMLAALAVVLATAGRGRASVLLALFAVIIAESFGMGVGDFLSKEKSDVGWKEALVMGLSTFGASGAIGIPWLFATGGSAEFGSGIMALLLGAAIAQMRPGGWDSWAQTLGLLAAVAAITGVVGHVA